jgi:hypothetical protein
MRLQLVLAAPVFIAALALTGCAPEAEPTPEATPEPVVSASPTPLAPLVTEPIPAFAGDCANVLSVDEATMVLSSIGALSGDAEASGLPPARSVQTAGGLWCQWYAGLESGAGFAVRLVALPLDAVPADLVASTSTVACDMGEEFGCRVSGTAGDIWVLAQVFGEGIATVEASGASLTSALDLALARSVSFPGPVAVSKTDAWWTLPDCAAIAESIGLTDLIGQYQDFIAGDRLRTGWDAVLRTMGVQLKCEWSTTETGSGGRIAAVTIAIEPGSGWSPRAHDPVPVTSLPVSTETASLTGATGATTWWTDERDMDGTIVTDGVNVFEVTIWGDPAQDSVPTAQRLLDALATAG